MNNDGYTICPVSGAIHAKPKEDPRGKVVANYIFSMSDVKEMEFEKSPIGSIEQGTITKIRFKRKGTYGGRYFGREVFKENF